MDTGSLLVSLASKYILAQNSFRTRNKKVNLRGIVDHTCKRLT